MLYIGMKKRKFENVVSLPASGWELFISPGGDILLSMVTSLIRSKGGKCMDWYDTVPVNVVSKRSGHERV